MTESVKWEIMESIYNQGTHFWNDWVKKNPNVRMDFSEQLFLGDMSFAGFHFPKNGVDFSNAKFKGNVDFQGMRFRGETGFEHTIFANGANFDGTTFAGEVNFGQAKFTRRAGFIEAKFAGNADFQQAKFAGEANFRGAMFKKRVRFHGAKFTEEVNFWLVMFTEEVNFREARFTGEANFRWVTFEDAVYFRGATFIEDAGFQGAKFTEKADFFLCQFRQRAVFLDLRDAGTLEVLNFSRTTFDGAFDLGADQPFNCIVDLTGTKMSHAMVLDSFHCTLKRNAPKGRRYLKCLGIQRVVNGEDGARCRRLKQLAFEGRDHKRALDYAVMEMQCARFPTEDAGRKKGKETSRLGKIWAWGKELRPWLPRWRAVLVEMPFWAVSDYGRSALRAFVWLGVVWLGFGQLYPWAADGFCDKAWVFSASNMLPFIGGGVRELADVQCKVSGGWIIFQGLISVVVLFQFALAIRNQLRV